MFAFRSIVIGRQIDELRSESAARRLARIAASPDAKPSHRPARKGISVFDEPEVVIPMLRNYPYPAR